MVLCKPGEAYSGKVGIEVPETLYVEIRIADLQCAKVGENEQALRPIGKMRPESDMVSTYPSLKQVLTKLN
jgi:hypothetical protein